MTHPRRPPSIDATGFAIPPTGPGPQDSEMDDPGDLELAKHLLVNHHRALCAMGWGLCPCPVAQAIRAIDSAIALDADCVWPTVRAESLWAKTEKGRH